MNTIVVMLIFLVFILAIFISVVCLVSNIYKAIVEYKKPELFCAKCGKRVSRKDTKCPKCKVRLKE